MGPELDRHRVTNGEGERIGDLDRGRVVFPRQDHCYCFVDVAVTAGSSCKSSAASRVADHHLPQNLAAARFDQGGGLDLVQTQRRQMAPRNGPTRRASR